MNRILGRLLVVLSLSAPAASVLAAPAEPGLGRLGAAGVTRDYHHRHLGAAAERDRVERVAVRDGGSVMVVS